MSADDPVESPSPTITGSPPGHADAECGSSGGGGFSLQGIKRKRSFKCKVPESSPPARIYGGDKYNALVAPAVSTPKKRKPDASLATGKITTPCSECGRRFWSWKALFGHMRCHPERQWRGINPPGNGSHRRRSYGKKMTLLPLEDGLDLLQCDDKDRELADCLILLANSPPSTKRLVAAVHEGPFNETFKHRDGGFMTENRGGSDNCLDLVCSSGSAGEDERGASTDVTTLPRKIHFCNICSRSYPTSEALGVHRHCHWDDDDQLFHSCPTVAAGKDCCDRDLNTPSTTTEQEGNHGQGLVVDLTLRLGV